MPNPVISRLNLSLRHTFDSIPTEIFLATFSDSRIIKARAGHCGMDVLVHRSQSATGNA